MRDSDSAIAASGGSYTQAETTLTFPLALTDGSFTFTIFDSVGDGICCGYGSGSYRLSIGTIVIASGGEFDTAAAHPFSLPLTGAPPAPPETEPAPSPPPTSCPIDTLPCITQSGREVCLRAVALSECEAANPSWSTPQCNVDTIRDGGYCEADGECGTSNIDNCDPDIGWDVYQVSPRAAACAHIKQTGTPGHERVPAQALRLTGLYPFAGALPVDRCTTDATLAADCDQGDQHYGDD